MVLHASSQSAVSRRGNVIAAILMTLAVSAISTSAQAAPNLTSEKGPVMTNLEAWNTYKKYLGAWNTTSLEERLRISADVLNDNIEYQTARHDLCTGRAQVIEDMATFHERFPGGHFEIGDVSSHHNVAVLSWVIIQADGKEFARGIDMITVDRNGQISKITTFAPSIKDPNAQ